MNREAKRPAKSELAMCCIMVMLAICCTVILRYNNNNNNTRLLLFAVVAKFFSLSLSLFLPSKEHFSIAVLHRTFPIFQLRWDRAAFIVITILSLPSLSLSSFVQVLSLISRNRRGGNFICYFCIGYQHSFLLSVSITNFSNIIAIIPFPLIRNDPMLSVRQHIAT